MCDAIDREELYLHYKDKVMAYIRGKVQNPHDAEDLVSTVFLKVYRVLPRFDPSRASLSTWIYTVTRNTVIDYYRTHKYHTELIDWIPDVEEELSDVSDELLEQLADALETLPEREHDLIVLHYYHRMTLKVIAERMGMSYPNAKVVHAKALCALREYFT